MPTTKKLIDKKRNKETFGGDYFERLWEQSWTYIKTVVDVVHEPILILDKNFRIMAANEPFYRTFEVESKTTEGKIMYDLGNGQWDIPELRELLESILPQNTFFKGFQVSHDFPKIGRKTMILNARQIYTQTQTSTDLFPSIILLAMEDVTEMMAIAETLATHTNRLEGKLTDRTKKLESHIEKLEKKINKIKKRFKKQYLKN